MLSLCRVLAASVLSAIALASLAAPLEAQQLRPAVDAWRRAHEREILDEAFALMAIPNVASDTANIRRNVEFLTAAFAKRGVAMRPLVAPTGGSPALFG